MEGEGGLAVMEIDLMSSPPPEYPALLEMPLLREEVASMTSKFPLEFSIFVILMIGSVMLLRCGFCFSVFVIT